MPITGAIPLPESGANAFMSGASQTQNMINGMMNNKHNQGMLSIQQAAQARAQELLPHLIQQYKDTHGKVASEQHMQDMYDTITQHEMRKARPDLFGGQLRQQMPQAQQRQQENEPAVNQNERHQLSDEDRKILVKKANHPDTPPEQRQQIEKYLEANPPVIQNNEPAYRKLLIKAFNNQNTPPEEKKKIAEYLQSHPALSKEMVGESPNDMGDNTMPMAQDDNVEQMPQEDQQAQQAWQIPQDKMQGQNQPDQSQDEQTQSVSSNQPSQMYDNGIVSRGTAGAYTDMGDDASISPEKIVATGTKGNEWKDELAGIGKFPGIETKPDFKNGLIFRKYPSGKQTIQKMQLPAGMTPEDTARQKATGKATGELIGQLESATLSDMKSAETLDRIGNILTNPTWKDMRSNPLFEGKQLDYFFTKAGTPEQQRLAGDFLAYTGQVVADMAGQFKGQFRIGEQHLIESMKVNKNDTLATAKGKLEALMTMNKMRIKRATIEANLMRKGMNPLEAAQQANKQVNGALVTKMISQKLGIDMDIAAEKQDAKDQKSGDERVSRGESREEKPIVMYKGQQRYEFPAKHANHPKLKEYTLAPT
jgi:hypothetical protein